MFAPRGYTAVPQDPVDNEEEDHLGTSYGQRRTTVSTNSEVMAGKSSVESDESEKEPRPKRNHVRFESKSVEEKPEPMSKARRLCFAASLMICTLTIFVFAFTVPCKRASCRVANIVPTLTANKAKFRGNWSVSFPGYSSVAETTLRESSQISNGELVVSYEMIESDYNLNQRRGSSHQGGLLSLSKENGALVWLYNASHVIKLIDCKFEKKNLETCLVESSRGELQLVIPSSNQIIWSTRILIGSILPSIIIGIADCDGDGVGEVLLSYKRINASQVMHSGLSNQSMGSFLGKIRVISGKTGRTLGGILTIPQSQLIERISLHSTSKSTNMVFILTVGGQGHLKVIPVHKFYKKILKAKLPGISTDLFQNTTVRFSQFVSLKHPPVVKDLNQDSVEDIVLVTLAGSRHSLTAVDGGKLKRMWRIAFGSRRILSQPVIGYFDGDDIPDILVVLQDQVLAMFNRSLIQILSGRDGNILWSRKLTLAERTSPLSARISHKSDAFLMWIEKEMVQKYEKIFTFEKTSKNRLSKKLSTTGTQDELVKNSGLNNTKNNKTTAYHPRHRRDEQFSIREMEEELDSLVREVNKQYRKPSVKTELQKFIPEKNGRTSKLLDNVVKNETGRTTVSTHRLFNSWEQLETNTNDIGTTMSTTHLEENIEPSEAIHRTQLLNKLHISKLPSNENISHDINLEKTKIPVKGDRSINAAIANTITQSNKDANKDANKVLRGQIHAAYGRSKTDTKFSKNGTPRSDFKSNTKDVSRNSDKEYPKSLSNIRYNASSEKSVRISKKDHVSGSFTSTSVENKITGPSRKRNGSSQINEINYTLAQREKIHDSKLVAKNASENMTAFNSADHKARAKYGMLKVGNYSRERSSDSWHGEKQIPGKVKYFNTSADLNSTHFYRQDFKNSDTTNKNITQNRRPSLTSETALKNRTQTTNSSKNLKYLLYNSFKRGNHSLKIGATIDAEIVGSSSSRYHNLINQSTLVYVNSSRSKYNVPSEYNRRRETSREDYVQNVGIHKMPFNNQHHTWNNKERRVTHDFALGNNGLFSKNDVNSSESIGEGIEERQLTKTLSDRQSLKLNHSTKVDPSRNTLTKNGEKFTKPEFTQSFKNEITDVSTSKNKGSKKIQFSDNLDRTVLKTIDNFVENKTSLVSVQEVLPHVTTASQVKPYKPKANRSTAGDYTNFQEFGSEKQRKRLEFKEENEGMGTPDTRLSYNKEQTEGCNGRGLALIAIFPNNPKNTFSVVSQEEYVPDKATTLGPCDAYWPSVNSNPIVHDVDRDGFLEIFYVVNNKITMTVKKLSLRLKQTP